MKTTLQEMKRIKKIILAFVLILVLVILLVLGVEAYIRQETAGMITNKIEKVEPVSTIIVLGASVHSDGQLSPILKDRVDAALDLFRSGKAGEILVSGDHRRDDYNEVSAMQNYLLKKGVPSNRILLDHAGIDTYDSMYRAKAVFGIKDAVVVTQKFHLPRAIFIAENLGLHYTGFAASSREYEPDNRILRREKLANIKALWELALHKGPATLKRRL